MKSYLMDYWYFLYVSHLRKLRLLLVSFLFTFISSCQQMRTASLPSNHMVKSLLEHHHSTDLILHCLSLEKLASKQRIKVKSSIIDANNYLNGILPSFNPLYKEFSSGFWLVDIFSNYFSFNTVDHKSNDAKSVHLCNFTMLLHL